MGINEADLSKTAGLKWERRAKTQSALPFERKQTVASRVSGALFRAILVGVLFALPAFVVPGIASQNGTVIFIISLSMMIWTFMEYASVSPSLIEFRNAPPFNRIRYMSLLVMVYCLSLIQSHMFVPHNTTTFIHNVGAIIGFSIDQPGSPVRLMMMQFPLVADNIPYATFLASTGIAYFISLVSLVIFMAVFFLRRWPSNKEPFNVWLNMPNFDPTTTDDVVGRLSRDARINIVLGFFLPFLIPPVIGVLFRFVGVSPFNDPYLMIWVTAAWAFLPSGMIMRGVAISRVAQMAANARQMQEEDDHDEIASVPGW